MRLLLIASGTAERDDCGDKVHKNGQPSQAPPMRPASRAASAPRGGGAEPSPAVPGAKRRKQQVLDRAAETARWRRAQTGPASPAPRLESPPSRARKCPIRTDE